MANPSADDNEDTAITGAGPSHRPRASSRPRIGDPNIARPGFPVAVAGLLAVVALGAVTIAAVGWTLALPRAAPGPKVRVAIQKAVAAQDVQHEIKRAVRPGQGHPRRIVVPELIRVAPRQTFPVPLVKDEEAAIGAELIYRAPEKSPISVAISPDGKRIAFESQFDRFVMDLATREAFGLPVQVGSVSCFSGDGRVVAVVAGHDAIFVTADGEKLGMIKAGSQIMNMALSRDGTRCVTGMPGDPVIGQDGKPKLKASGVPQWENCNALVWDTRSGEKIVTATATMPVWTSAIADDGAILTSGSDGFRRFDARTGEQIDHSEHGIQPAGFSVGGRFLAGRASGKLNDLVVWDVGEKQLMKTVNTPGQILHHFALSRDGSTLLVSGRNTKIVDGEGSTSLWDVAAGKMLRRAPFPCYFVAISDDGGTAVFGDNEGRIWRWTK